MSEASREMSLEEYLGVLGPEHRAFKEYQKALQEKDAADQKRFMWILGQVPGIEKCDNLDQQIGWMTAEISKLKNLEEQRIMELAGISTASIQNTEESKKERIPRDNPYWTVAYGDVCVAVDREIKLREKAKALEEKCRNLEEELRKSHEK